MIGIYLRVSSNKQDEAMQINAIKRLLKVDNIEYENCRIYQDHGITGSTTERPDYQRLIIDITNGDIDKVIAYEFSRLWRDLEEQNRMFKFFKKLNIELQSVTEGMMINENDELKANMLGSINQHFLKALKRRIREGIDAKKKDISEGKDIWKGRGIDKKPRKLRGSPK